METFQSIKAFETENMVAENFEVASDDAVISEEIEKFNTDYSNEKIKELTNAFDSITIDEEVLNSITMQEDDVLVREKVSFRTKLFMVCAISITSLLLFLCIYNIFRINSMSAGIQLLEGNIATETNIYNALQNDVNSMNDTSNIMGELGSKGYFEVNENDLIYVEVDSATPVVDVQGSTNWFDSVCNFISSVFGG